MKVELALLSPLMQVDLSILDAFKDKPQGKYGNAFACMVYL